MRVGIVFGCFIPMHEGHWRLIHRALCENGRVIIAVCGYDGDRGEGFLPFRERYELMRGAWLRELEAHSVPRADVRVVCVDDHKIGLTGTFSEEAWSVWGDEVFAQSGMRPEEHRYTWYTGEVSYVKKLALLYPTHDFVLVGRAARPVSGSMIREDWRAHRGEIDDVFLERLYQKFGTEGKR